MKSVGVFITQYSLLLYLLINKNWKDTIFLWQPGMRIETYMIDNMRALGATNMWGCGYVDGIKIASNKKYVRGIIFRLIQYCLRLRIKFLNISLLGNTKNIVYGQDHSSLAHLLYYENTFINIEDGLGNYVSKERLIESLKVNSSSLLENIIPFGFSKYIDKIYLTGRLPIADEYIKNKTKIFNIKELWQKKTNDERKEILSIFGYDVDKMKKIVSEGRDVFVITQRYSPEYCTHQELVNIYKNLIGNIDMKKIVIKPHPDDVIEYEKYFPDCMILRDNFPFELVYLTEIPIYKIISINSTTIYGLWDDSIIESHEEIYQRLFYRVKMH